MTSPIIYIFHCKATRTYKYLFVPHIHISLTLANNGQSWRFLPSNDNSPTSKPNSPVTFIMDRNSQDGSMLKVGVSDL